MFDYVLAIILISIFTWYLKSRHPRNCPPGPDLPLPIIGDFWQAGGLKPDCIFRGFQQFQKEYGDIYTCWFGPLRAVVIGNLEIMNDVMMRNSFSARAEGDPISIRGGSSFGKFPGLAFSSGKTWMEQRRFTLHTLRDFGFGKKGIEELVQDEVGELNKFLEGTNGKPVFLQNTFNLAILNSLWKLISGERMEYHDKKLHKIIRDLNSFVEDVGSIVVNIVFFTTPLSRLAKKLKLLKVYDYIDSVLSYSRQTLQEHESSFDENNIRDFTDVYIDKIHTTTDPTSSFHGRTGYINFENTVFDLFLAGSETTSTTLNWAFLHLLLNPHVQDKIHEELDREIGRNRMITKEDRLKTPYIEAVLHEVQRFSVILPISLLHETTEDSNIGNYFVPKGTTIVNNLYHVMHDPKNFANPEDFNPNRFLKDGQFIPNPKVIPFGIGKRRCLGETLARLELYMFFAGILQRFQIVEGNPNEELTLDVIYGGTMMPKPYSVKLVPRD